MEIHPRNKGREPVPVNIMVDIEFKLYHQP